MREHLIPQPDGSHDEHIDDPLPHPGKDKSELLDEVLTAHEAGDPDALAAAEKNVTAYNIDAELTRRYANTGGVVEKKTVPPQKDTQTFKHIEPVNPELSEKDLTKRAMYEYHDASMTAHDYFFRLSPSEKDKFGPILDALQEEIEKVQKAWEVKPVDDQTKYYLYLGLKKRFGAILKDMRASHEPRKIE